MGQIFQSLGIEWPVVIAQAVAFVILVGILAQYLYGPIQAILRQRQEQIANSLAGAEAQQLKAESLRQEYDARLAGIADEARARLDQAMKDAETARLRLLDNAQQEVRDLHQRGQAQMALEREQLRRELRQEVADVAVLAATKALRGQMTPALHEAVNDQVIRELDQRVNV